MGTLIVVLLFAAAAWVAEGWAGGKVWCPACLVPAFTRECAWCFTRCILCAAADCALDDISILLLYFYSK